MGAMTFKSLGFWFILLRNSSKGNAKCEGITFLPGELVNLTPFLMSLKWIHAVITRRDDFDKGLLPATYFEINLTPFTQSLTKSGLFV